MGILCIYRPPAKSVQTFLEELQKFLEHNKTKSLIIIGDMNIDTLAADAPQSTQKYVEIMNSYGLQETIHFYTREEYRNGVLHRSCLDHIFYRGSANSIVTSVLETKISDHYMINAAIRKKLPRPPDRLEVVSIMNRKDYIKELEHNLSKENSYKKTENKSTYEKLKVAINESKKAASNERVVKKRSIPLNPWMCSSILRLIAERDKIFQVLKRKRYSEGEGAVLRTNYKYLRNKVNSEIKTAKRNYYHRIFHSAANDMRKSWQLVNTVLGRKKNRSSDEIIFDSFKAETCEERQGVVDAFADALSNQATVNIHVCDKVLFNQSKVCLETSIFVRPATEYDVERKIGQMENKKAAGFDNMKPRDLKDAISMVKAPIANIVNECMEGGHMEEQLKQAIVRPIFKNGTKSDTGNYRPISLLPVISKVAERHVGDILTGYLRSKNILDIRQFAFQKGKGTTDLLEEVTDIINESLDKGIHVVCLFIDFTKAFDTINHKKLLTVLENIGVRGNIFDFFRSYLHKRTYKVKVGNFESISKDLTRGVPQGSILGPILYALYVNDVGKCFSSCEHFLYADDTLIMSRNKDFSRAITTLQDEFNLFQKWAHDKELVINSKKTKVMHFRSPKMKYHMATNLIVHSMNCLHNNILTCTCLNKIDVVKEYRYLGIIFDEHLTWRPHTTHLRKKLKCMSYNFYFLRTFVPYKTLMIVYNAIVKSIIAYGITIYGQASKYIINGLQSSQNGILHHINWARKFSNSYDAEVDTFNIEQIFVQKMLQNNYKDTHTWGKIKHNMGTRAEKRGTFKVGKSFNKYGERSKRILLRRLFNRVPPGLLQSVGEQGSSSSIMKKRIKDWVAHNV